MLFEERYQDAEGSVTHKYIWSLSWVPGTDLLKPMQFPEMEVSFVICKELFLITLVMPWTRACQPPLSMEFSRPENWSGQPSPSPGDLPNPGIDPRSPTLQVDSLQSEPPRKPLFDHTQVNELT